MKKSKIKNKEKIIIITGPTSTGKSELAVKIAKKINGEIISVDSRQIYKELNIGSGKVPVKLNPQDGLYYYKKIPHHLLSITSLKKDFTAFDFKKIAFKKIKEIWQKKKIPILCGGTGFYLKILIDGLIVPQVPPQPEFRKKIEKLTTEELAQKLLKKDKERAKNIDLKNRRRLIRALEIIKFFKKVPPLKTKPLKAEILIIGLKKSKSELKKNIKKRINEWLKKGLLKEIDNLLKKGVKEEKIKQIGLVYYWALLYYQEKINKQEFKDKLLKAMLKYVKRQLTWFKKDKRIIWIEEEKEAEKLVKNFLKN